jgi:hypothetical protein
MSINTDGPEGKNVLSDFHEDEIKAFFSNFLKWELIYKNFDVQFLNVDTEKEENRGFDFLYKMYDPFLQDSSHHGVIVEVKGVKDAKQFNKSRLTKDIDTLKYKIENLRTAKKLHDDPQIIENEINYYKYGILCYRFSNFDYDKYKKVLMEYQISETRNGDMFPTIFVLTNDRLSTYLQLKEIYKSLKYYYPYYREHGTNEYSNKLALSYLFSDMIPFTANGKKCILSFDTPSPSAFNLLENFCGEYQYHDIDEIILAKSDYKEEATYTSYLSKWEKNANNKKINVVCLEQNQSCGKNLAKVFSDER